MKTDTQIQSDVMSALKWDPSVTEALIGVSALDGIVTLSGNVPSYMQKYTAEKAARKVCGVKALVEKLNVKYDSDYERDDQDIAKAIVDHLSWNYQVPNDTIKVEVDSGIVELTGEVQWGYQRAAAEYCIQGLAGIIGINNNISIKTKDAQPDVIKQKIEDALQNEAGTEAKNIQVRVNGGNVTLSGDVHSFSEMDNAKWAAWGAPGVTDVTNNLQVNNYH